jgi:hypothetical protein
MKILIYAIGLLIGFQSLAQKEQKKYKYVIVPLQYNFTTEPNQYQLNVLTRVRLKEEGFEVYMSEGEKIPQYVIDDRCKYLRADVKKDKGLFASNLRFQLFNCFGNLVYESAGTSREKAYEDAYKEALDMALKEFQIESYKFVATVSEEENSEIVEDIDEAPKSFEETATSYKFNGKQLWMAKNGDDYVLYEDLGETIWANLKFADRGTYSFNSENVDGAAYFTPEGDIVIEYLSKNEDAVQKMVFERQ